MCVFFVLVVVLLGNTVIVLGVSVLVLVVSVVLLFVCCKCSVCMCILCGSLALLFVGFVVTLLLEVLLPCRHSTKAN